MEAKIDAVLSKMEIAAEKVELYCNSKVKLPMAELDYLKTLEDARDFMTMMVTKTSDNRQQLADIFGGDCSRIARIRTVLDGVVLSDMNCNDQRVRTCTEACATIEKVLEDMGLGWCLKKACDEQKANLGRRRSSVDREALLAASQAAQAAAQAAEALETEEVPTAPVAEEPPAKASKAADLWAQSFDEDFVKRVLACTEATELHSLEKEALASKSSKTGNWMIWMVHRAHLDDPTLVKFDFTNLKMPEGSVEPLISPKLAVAMESNTHIEQLLMGCTNLQDPEAAILAVSLRSNSSLKVLNIDTNAIQPLTLESIAKGTSVNQALQELRCNNTANGRLVTEAFLHALKSNPMMCKLGYPVTDPYFRGEIDKQLTRNNDAARKRRLEEKRRREAEGDTTSPTSQAGYPAVKASPKAANWPPKLSEAEDKEVKEKAEREKTEKEKAEKEQAEKERAEKEKEEKEKAEREKAETEKAEREKAEREKAEQEKAEQEKAEQEKAEKEKAEKERAEKERAEKEMEERAAKEMEEKERAEKEQAEKEKVEQERAAREQEEKEKAEKEQEKIGKVAAETDKTQIESSDIAKAAPQSIESFLREPLDALPGMVDASGAESGFRGYLYKKSPSARFMKSWDWRFFVVQGQRLVWWRRDHDVPKSAADLAQSDPSGCKGFINFAVSRARVVPDDKNPAVFALEAVDGAWKDGSLKDMSDAQRTFEFDCTDSAHTREEWMAALRALQT
ncbi:unnamed protein product [Symbiodinium pilosum]|uniref:PH domain-containing protein n=1 Tax=Symbiodinium pilosum TaxID=2952 RepID=A0A812YJG9_SYMPI|nr:unnamed protein product [Symbiodinium pilosum]